MIFGTLELSSFKRFSKNFHCLQFEIQLWMNFVEIEFKWVSNGLTRVSKDLFNFEIFIQRRFILGSYSFSFWFLYHFPYPFFICRFWLRIVIFIIRIDEYHSIEIHFHNFLTLTSQSWNKLNIFSNDSFVWIFFKIEIYECDCSLAPSMLLASSIYFGH